MLVTIGGKRWRLVFEGTPRDANGACEHPDKVGKKIRIRRTLRGELRLETIIHEVLHAADWTKDEEWVGQIATDLARILTRLGYTDGNQSNAKVATD